MVRHQRLSAVMELIARQGSLSVEELAEAFEVSPATARRDLDDLAGQQLVSRTHGGAIVQAVTYDLPLRYRTSRQPDQKSRIAAVAAELAASGSVVALNGGTTTTAVARAIAVRADLGREQPSMPTSLTVVTNALNIAHELAVRPQLKVVVVGGVLRSLTFELVGPFARQVLDGITIDTTFLGVDAISSVHGLATADELEAETNRSMVQRSRRVVVVADSTKLEQRAFSTICALDDVDVLITGGEADPVIVQRFTDAGLDVRLA